MTPEEKLLKTLQSKQKNQFKITCCSFPVVVWFTSAFCMSWYFNHSIAWAIFHGLFGWLYLAYKTMWYFVTNL